MGFLSYFKFFIFVAVGLGISSCGGPVEKPLPKEKPEAVAKRFYEYISEAGIRGGTLTLKEAYKMVSVRDRMSERRFIGVVKKYPPGFKVDIIDTKIRKEERQAVVSIEYKMASMFGAGYTMSDELNLVVDEGSDVWKVDFTGESDAQDVETLKKKVL